MYGCMVIELKDAMDCSDRARLGADQASGQEGQKVAETNLLSNNGGGLKGT